VPADIVFIGSSTAGLLRLIESPHFVARGVLCLQKRVTTNLERLARDRGLELKTFKGVHDFRQLIGCYPASMPFLIYQLDMLIPGDLTDRYCFYNIHRGSLRTNRGPNPDVWPILNGDFVTELSLHRINDKVDSGVFIDSIEIPIERDDDTNTLPARMEQSLPALIESLHDYLTGVREGTDLSGGTYRPWIMEEDFTIDLGADSVEVIDRKIRSQRRYNGAILLVGNQRLYVTDIIAVRRRNEIASEMPASGNGIVNVSSQSHDLSLRLNTDPKYPRVTKRPPSKRV
jgi:hypothetical protein